MAPAQRMTRTNREVYQKPETLHIDRREEEGKPSVDWVGLAGLRQTSGGPSEDGWGFHRGPYHSAQMTIRVLGNRILYVIRIRNPQI